MDAAGLDGLAQGRILGQQTVLADHVGQMTWAHAFGQWLQGGIGEQITHPAFG
jgi:hypothetical protein